MVEEKSRYVRLQQELGRFLYFITKTRCPTFKQCCGLCKKIDTIIIEEKYLGKSFHIEDYTGVRKFFIDRLRNCRIITEKKDCPIIKRCCGACTYFDKLVEDNNRVEDNADSSRVNREL
jgi:hypothetical protein